MLSHFRPLEILTLCIFLIPGGVNAYPSPSFANRRPSRRDDSVEEPPISFSRGAKIGVIVGTIFVVSMLVIWLFVRNRGAWKETDFDHGVQPPNFQEASRRHVHLERVSNVVPPPRDELAEGGEPQGGVQEDWRRSSTTAHERNLVIHTSAPAYVVPPVPPPAYSASGS
ncbi:hypothetical protein BDY24DRAFT_396710, partial [Mrakia frigida]|uniref:uncharacterized protein n=1 Tax=Mrakia frigida TaxID=29902 RepID=UPI003FCBF85B